jgi:uncharacterized membrane protein
MFDLDDPLYRRLWVRIAIVAVCLVWAAVEFYNGQLFWGGLFVLVGGYAAWRFFVVFSPRGDEPP